MATRRGSISKEILTEKILTTFEGAFKSDKEIRIPMEENGEEVQIKITLTAAATNIEHDGGISLSKMSTSSSTTPIYTEPTEEEKERLAKMIDSIYNK